MSVNISNVKETTTRLQQCKNFIALQKVYLKRAQWKTKDEINHYKRVLFNQVTSQFITLVVDEYSEAINNEVLKFRTYLLNN